ncbi:riboflavin biosynthesis protein RibD [Bacteroidia bacterium]|nr:riboflavin biosynthesis protein RibD [Bacteroidia bacterium]
MTYFSHEHYMQRCLQLAKNGISQVAPNPMVGSVIVCDERIIGEGFHKRYGGHHAEVEAINSVKDTSLLKKSTLYVNLEPCSHFGKTPPCADLIIATQIPKVVIGTRDPNPKVAGRGIRKLQEAGIEVVEGILEPEGQFFNRRFLTFITQQRPYIILKWAQSTDGYIGKQGKNIRISDEFSRILLHKWRSEEAAVMVGTTTAIIDNPQLNVRHYYGRQPLRVTVDTHGRLPKDLNLLDTSQQDTHIYTTHDLHAIVSNLYERGIQSLIVEGGAQLLNSFLAENLWDEARIIKSAMILGDGIKAPSIEDIDGEKHAWGTILFH